MRSLALLLFLLTGCSASGHELPQRVAVRIVVAVDTDQNSAQIMVRVPLEAMRDIDFPLEGPGYLVIDRAEEALAEAAGLWIVDEVTLRAQGKAIVPEHIDTRIALPANRAFDSLSAAEEHFAAPRLDPANRVFWRQALLDVRMQLPLPEKTSLSALTLDATLQHLGVTTRLDLLYVGADGKAGLRSFDGYVEGLALEPSLLRVAQDFLAQGVTHIWGGLDHLLFLVCLVLPLRRFWPLFKTITAFTVAHSITLGAAALGYVPGTLWFPALVEGIIALSIVLLAIENALLSKFPHRPAVAAAFGLAHGFGFSFALAESLPQSQGQNLLALASFNVGVEIGQIVVLVALLVILRALSKVLSSERTLRILVSLLVGHTAWHWMVERLEVLQGYW